MNISIGLVRLMRFNADGFCKTEVIQYVKASYLVEVFRDKNVIF